MTCIMFTNIMSTHLTCFVNKPLLCSASAQDRLIPQYRPKNYLKVHISETKSLENILLYCMTVSKKLF